MEFFFSRRGLAAVLTGSFGGFANHHWQGVLTGSKGVVNHHWQGVWTGSKGVVNHHWQGGQSWGCFLGVNQDARRGSALLVVLGMLAFMLFSGLAFSVYMRQSRLPTSFLRRTVATRQLAKAALAEAIEEIDTAIGNDPHPNVRTRTYSGSGIGNFWQNGCVFTGEGTSTNPEQENNSSANQNTTYYPTLVGTSETVPTLTLEGLAYLPPCLINEARYYSQRTPTAKWHSFWFDSGRYAYTAFDVSDYFDINRVYANKPRSSGNRISLAHIFEKISREGDEFVHSDAGSGADKWDQFMEEYRVDNNDLPLVSMADFNVEWNQKGALDFGGDSCIGPFASFVKNGLAYNVGEVSSTMERYRMMTFVTDGYFPNDSAKNNTTDLSTSQPFESDLLMSGYNPKWRFSDDVMRTIGSSEAGKLLQNYLSPVSIAMLLDYLDENDVPFSLAIPSVERVPMICGAQPMLGESGQTVKLIVREEVTADADKNNPIEVKEKEYRKFRRQYKYSLNVKALNDLTKGATILATYPFLDRGYSQDLMYKVDGRMSVFLSNNTKQSFPLRTSSDIAGLCIDDERKDFTKSYVLANSIVYPMQSVSLPRKIGNADNPCDAYSLRVTENADVSAQADLFTVTYEWNRDVWDVNMNDGDGGWRMEKADPDYEAGSSDYVASKTTAGAFSWLISDTQQKNSDFKFLEKGGLDLQVNVAAWLRVSRDKLSTDVGTPQLATVDLVPSRFGDEKYLNNVDTSDSMMLEKNLCFGAPVLRFNGPTVHLGLLPKDKNEIEVTLVDMPKAIVADPRFNHAPENWFTIGTGAPSAQDWKDNNHATDSGKDGDVYMATSDAKYMQSIYELSFLPKLGDIRNGTLMPSDWPEWNEKTVKGYGPNLPTSFGATMHNKWMWSTYCPYSHDGIDDDDLERIGLTSGEGGMKVNPYSDSVKVLMAAFANTPHDWRVAATNDDEISGMTASQFNKKYAWNDYSSESTGKMCWDCLSAIAEEFSAKVQKTGDWEDAFADLIWDKSEWRGDEKTKHIIDFEEIDYDEETDSPIYSVDKKFLYGFWHDSFSARQQLFLIFVRAEPMMMGGGVSGQIPPQLSARAVALVWRDPTKTENRSGANDTDGATLANPHRTRILFYHQFD